MQLHRATGVALAGAAGGAWPEQAAELARHWLAATPPVGADADDVRRTLDYAEEAARRAAGALAHEEAAALLRRALPLVDRIDDPGRRAAMLVALGEAQHHAGDAAHRQTLVDAADAALQIGNASLAVRAALANQRPPVGTFTPERVALLERVLDALPPDDTSDRARVLVALAGELHHSTDPRRHEFAHEAVAVARRVDDPACLAWVLGLAAFALWQPENLPERVEIASELSAIAAAQGDPVLEINGGLALYYAAAMYSDFDRARAGLSTATRAAEELGQPAQRLRVLLAQQSCALLEGRFADFERFSGEAFHFGEALGNPDAGYIHRGDGGTMRFLRGDVSEALEGFRIAAEIVPHPALKAGIAMACAELGELAAAQAVLTGLGVPSLDGIPRDYLWLFNLILLAASCGPLGDQELARRLYDELLPYRSQMVLAQVSALGPVAHYLGVLAAVLGRPEEADGHFAFACDLMERTRTRGMLVRTRLEWARFLLARNGPGDSARAEELAAAALELALELGAPNLAERASELLTSRGKRR
jgi:hypothetical protein